MFREGIAASILSGIMIVIVIVFLVIGGLVVDQVFLEPGRQNAYQFKVSDRLNTWCMAPADDAFNAGTLTQLKTDREDTRFQRLPSTLQSAVNNAVTGNRQAACNLGK